LTEAATRLVIGVASGVGGGKTTLARALAQSLGEHSMLAFDHFEQITALPPADIQAWLLAGAEPDHWHVPGLEDALVRLRAGETVSDPLTGERISARRYVIHEAPFGRWAARCGQYIDMLVWIDTPLDIALARKLRQLLGGFPGSPDSLQPWLAGYLTNYLDFVEALLRVQREKVRPAADIVVDGLVDPRTSALAVIRALDPPLVTQRGSSPDRR
jgi:uridine kinase